MLTLLKEKSKLFYSEFLSSSLFLILVFSYVVLKIASNIAYGASYFTAFRSSITGTFFYLLSYYIISILSSHNDETERIFNIKDRKAKSGFIISVVYFILILLTIIDGLQRKDILSGYPILSYLPGYNWLNSVADSISVLISGIADFIEPYQIKNIIIGNIFYVIIPFIIFKISGYSFKEMFSIRNTRASWPFLAIYLLMFLVNGLSIKRIWGLIYSFLYPGICEEFYHRGIILRTTSGIFNRTVVSLIVGTLFFCLIHFPDYYFRVYEGNLLMTFSNMADVLMYGIFLAYGFRKTGSLIPWMIVHALSDSIYL